MSNTELTEREEQRAGTINRRTLLGGAAILTAAGVVSVGSQVFAQDADHNHGEASPSASPQASPSASPAGDMTVVAVDIAFEPKELTIAADTDVVVTIENQGMLQHDFTIDELGVKSDLLNGGESTEVTINAAAGTYEYYCSVTGHKEAGMVGTLTVE
jgi:uncharacterized cupredoxin-like copper-binding protein